MADTKNGTEKTWEERIEDLMKECKMEEETKDIIEKVKVTAKGNESDELLYERAWRRFRDLLLAS